MTTATDLTKIIDKMVEEKTFSLDAMEGLQNLRLRAKEMEMQVARLEDQLKSSQATNTTVSKQLAETNELNRKWNEREAALAAREKHIFEHEKNVAVAQAEAKTLTYAFDKLFKNTVVRESVVQSIPLMGPNMSCPTVGSGTETRSKEKE